MITNLERFKKDLSKLIVEGIRLELAIQRECLPDEYHATLTATFGDAPPEYTKDLPAVRETYQKWYSESLALLRQLLPDRVADFVRHYEKPKGRKEITYENYRIEDYLQGLNVTRGIYKEKVVGPDAAIPHLRQQLAIVQAAEARFDSSLFEIRQLVQADLLDSELVAAEELAKHRFVRAAGAVAGVVLEKQLAQVCQDHKINTSKKNPTISIYNDSLKAAGVIDLPQFRFIQHLADIRNLCDHGRTQDPTGDQVADLLAGVKKVIKTVY